MPSVIMGNSRDDTYVGDLQYKYPKGMNLRPDSDLHKKIIGKLTRMIDDSYSVMSKRHSVWNGIDETMKVYIPLSDAEKKIKAGDKTKPLSIVVPYSYAVLETIMAYMTKAFLSDSVFQYEGCSAEDTVPAKLLELVVNQHVRRFKSILEIHTSLRDGFCYGFGASGVIWTERWGKKPQTREVLRNTNPFMPAEPMRIKENVDALLFEGNEVVAIDPYRFLPDPNVSIHNFQSGEFVGWMEFKSLYKLLGEEQTSNDMFNVKYLKQQGMAESSSKYTADPSKRILTRDDRRTVSSTNYLTVCYMYVTLIPKDWGLPAQGSGDYPEIWMFEVVNEQIVVRAKPLGLNHGLYPLAVTAPDYDGYSATPLARMELVGGLQTALDWMFNSHIANVRKALNDMLIVDPSLINMDDMQNPEPGKLVRLRRSAWGRGVKDAVQQLAVTDITRGNMEDAQRIMEIMQKSSAATDSTMGVIKRGGERVSASEFSGTMQMAISRLDHMATIISHQYLQDLAYLHASHTQQLMSEDIYVKAVGEWPEILESEFGSKLKDIYGKKVPVSPFDIIADFDIIFRDGSTSSADAISNDFWLRSFQILSQNPVLAQNFDIVRIFKHMARINGAKNVNDFVIQGGDMNAVTASPDEISSQVGKGNLVDIQDYLAAQ